MHPSLFAHRNDGLNIEAAVTRLQAKEMKIVVSARELPLSRNKGFPKSAFCAALPARGISYLHAPALDCPMPMPIRN